MAKQQRNVRRKERLARRRAALQLRNRRRVSTFERLEERQMLSLTTSLTPGQATFTGDDLDDGLYLRATAGGVLEYSSTGPEGTYSSDLDTATPGEQQLVLTSARLIQIDLGGGSDVLGVDTSLTARLASSASTLVFAGGAGDDALVGPAADNTWALTAAGAGTLNGSVQFTTVERRVGGSGNDVYRLAANSSLGSLVIDEIAGGTDTLDFSGTSQGVTVDISNAGQQTVNSNLTLNLSSGETFENVIGGSGADRLTSNERDNRLIGGAGNDTLAGGGGDDVYVFSAGFGSDTITEDGGASSGGGFDKLDTTGVSADTTVRKLSDGTARLWDAATSEQLGPPLEHQAPVTWAEFRPDGRVLATCSQDQTVRLWDVATGQPIGEPQRHDDVVRQVLFSANGRCLLTRAKQTVSILSGDDGRTLVQPIRHEGPVLAARLQATSHWFMTAQDAGDKSQVRVWLLPWGWKIASFLTGPLRDADVNEDLTRVVVAGRDGHAWVADFPSGEHRAEIVSRNGAIENVAFSVPGDYLASLGVNHWARVWDSRTALPMTGELPHYAALAGRRLGPRSAVRRGTVPDCCPRLAQTAVFAAGRRWDAGLGGQITARLVDGVGGPGDRHLRADGLPARHALSGLPASPPRVSRRASHRRCGA